MHRDEICGMIDGAAIKMFTLKRLIIYWKKINGKLLYIDLDLANAI